jgi:hypothetical protein
MGPASGALEITTAGGAGGETADGNRAADAEPVPAAAATAPDDALGGGGAAPGDEPGAAPRDDAGTLVDAGAAAASVGAAAALGALLAAAAGAGAFGSGPLLAAPGAAAGMRGPGTTGLTAGLPGVSGPGDAPGADGGFGMLLLRSESAGFRDSTLGAVGDAARLGAGALGNPPRDGALAPIGELFGATLSAAVRLSPDVPGMSGAFGTTGGGMSQSPSSGGFVSGAGGISLIGMT